MEIIWQWKLPDTVKKKKRLGSLGGTAALSLKEMLLQQTLHIPVSNLTQHLQAPTTCPASAHVFFNRFQVCAWKKQNISFIATHRYVIRCLLGHDEAEGILQHPLFPWQAEIILYSRNSEFLRVSWRRVRLSSLEWEFTWTGNLVSGDVVWFIEWVKIRLQNPPTIIVALSWGSRHTDWKCKLW